MPSRWSLRNTLQLRSQCVTHFHLHLLPVLLPVSQRSTSVLSSTLTLDSNVRGGLVKVIHFTQLAHGQEQAGENAHTTGSSRRIRVEFSVYACLVHSVYVFAGFAPGSP
jgi:hypothetical protein